MNILGFLIAELHQLVSSEIMSLSYKKTLNIYGCTSPIILNTKKYVFDIWYLIDELFFEKLTLHILLGSFRIPQFLGLL